MAALRTGTSRCGRRTSRVVSQSTGRADRRPTADTSQPREEPRMFAQAVRTDHRGLRPLRPALRRLRPRPGPHRGRVGQGDHRQGRGQRRPRLPHPRDPDQGAALRARQAPPVGAVDRLLQAPALREVPAAAHRWSTRPPSWPARPAPRASSTRPRPTSCSPRSTRSPRSSGRPRRPERSEGLRRLEAELRSRPTTARTLIARAPLARPGPDAPRFADHPDARRLALGSEQRRSESPTARSRTPP